MFGCILLLILRLYFHHNISSSSLIKERKNVLPMGSMRMTNNIEAKLRVRWFVIAIIVVANTRVIRWSGPLTNSYKVSIPNPIHPFLHACIHTLLNQFYWNISSYYASHNRMTWVRMCAVYLFSICLPPFNSVIVSSTRLFMHIAHNV